MATITIMGTGLIGASMGLYLRQQGYLVIGVEKNAQNLRVSQEIGAVDFYCPSVFEAAKSSEVIILTTPVDTIRNTLPHLLDSMPENVVVIDTGSTKQSICQAIQNHKRREAFVAAHPMAGSEQSGPMGADVNLFVGKSVAICESELSAAGSLSKALGIFMQLGMSPVFISPNNHDSTVAAVSHLPQLIAYVYASMSFFQNSSNRDWVKLASSGFDSTTRLAASSANVWLPTINQNKENIAINLINMAEALQQMARLVEGNNTQELMQIIEQANSTRETFNHQQNNKKTESTLTK